MEKSLIIKRYYEDNKQTLGKMYVCSGLEFEKIIDTLELPYKNNENQLSCIPKGIYEVVKRHSEKYKNHFHVLDVENRSMILIHNGNYYTNTLGCILVGSGLSDINKDGHKDVLNSTSTLEELYCLMPGSFKLMII